MRRSKGYICQTSLPFLSNIPRVPRPGKPTEFETYRPAEPITREARCLVMEEPQADSSEQEKET